MCLYIFSLKSSIVVSAVLYSDVSNTKVCIYSEENLRWDTYIENALMAVFLCSHWLLWKKLFLWRLSLIFSKKIAAKKIPDYTKLIMSSGMCFLKKRKPEASLDIWRFQLGNFFLFCGWRCYIFQQMVSKTCIIAIMVISSGKVWKNNGSGLNLQLATVWSFVSFV